MQCPICNGHVTRVEVSRNGGTIAYSLCCGVPLEILDNWEVYEALPEPLQNIAIERAKADHEALRQKWADDTKRFKEALVKHGNRKGLMKGKSYAYQG